MDTSICVWFYQEVFPKLNYTQSIHSELLFSFKKKYCKNTPSIFSRIVTEMQSTLSKRHHFWDGQSMAEAGPWGRLFWREMTVAGKINFPLWFPFSGVHWRCLWPRWLGELDSPDTEGVHSDCWVRAFCLATPSPPPPPPPSPLPYPLEYAKRMIC